MSPAKIVERDNLRQKKRQKATNKIVDGMEDTGVMKMLYKQFKENLAAARDAKVCRIPVEMSRISEIDFLIAREVLEPRLIARMGSLILSAFAFSVAMNLRRFFMMRLRCEHRAGHIGNGADLVGYMAAHQLRICAAFSEADFHRQAFTGRLSQADFHRQAFTRRLSHAVTDAGAVWIS